MGKYFAFLNTKPQNIFYFYLKTAKYRIGGSSEIISNMSQRNLPDETFGDISGFVALRRNLDTSVEAVGGVQIKSHAGNNGDETMAHNIEISSPDIESEMEYWSGPETLSEQDIWGESECSENGQNPNKSLSGHLEEGEQIPDIDGIIDNGKLSMEDNSSTFPQNRGENALEDVNFKETTLIQEIIGEEDSDQTRKNIADEVGSQVEENFKDADTNSMSASIQNDSYSSTTEENIRTDQNNLVDGNSKDAGNTLAGENTLIEDSYPVDENDTVDTSISVDENVKDTDENSVDDTPSADENILDFDGSKPESNCNDDTSMIILPIENLSPSPSVENIGNSALNVNDAELSIREEDSKNEWTVLEIWSCFAMISGVLPYWISNDGQQTSLRKSFLSKVDLKNSINIHI